MYDRSNCSNSYRKDSTLKQLTFKCSNKNDSIDNSFKQQSSDRVFSHISDRMEVIQQFDKIYHNKIVKKNILDDDQPIEEKDRRFMKKQDSSRIENYKMNSICSMCPVDSMTSKDKLSSESEPKRKVLNEIITLINKKYDKKLLYRIV